MDIEGKMNAIESSKNKNGILIATILASGMGIIDSTALNVALPSIQQGLKASGHEVLWIVNGYMLVIAALIMIGGSLGDRYGRKRIFLFGIIVFVLSSLACSFARDATWLITSRISQGIGSAFMIPGSLSIITAAFGPDERSKAIGTWSAAGALMVILGPPLGGFFADVGWWRGVFIINVPIGVLVLWLVYQYVEETKDAEATQSLDFLGMLLTVFGLGLITYAFTSWPGGDIAQKSWLIACIAVGFGMVILLGFVEARKNEQAMIPIFLFKSSIFSGANLLTFFLYAALSISIFYLSLFLTGVQGYSFKQAGLAFVVFPIPLIALSSLSGAMAGKYGPRFQLITGPLITGCALWWLGRIGITPGPHEFWKYFLLPLLLFGVGMSFVVAPLTSTVMGAAPVKYSGAASGINNAVTRTASVLSVALTGSLGILFFSQQLAIQLHAMHLPPQLYQNIMATSNRLALTHIPAELPFSQSNAVREAVRTSFVLMFKNIMNVCAGLAFLSSLTAMLFIKSEKIKNPPAVA